MRARAGKSSRSSAARADPARPAAATIDASRLARLACQTGDRGDVLAIERGTQRRRALAGDAIGLGDRRHQRRQRDVHRQMRHPDRGQGLASDRDGLDVGRRAAGADQFGPDLPELALGPHLRGPDAQHLAGVTEAQWPGPVRQTGGGDPGDLRRHVGAHRHHSVRNRIHRAEGVARHHSCRHPTATFPRTRPAAA